MRVIILKLFLSIQFLVLLGIVFFLLLKFKILKLRQSIDQGRQVERDVQDALAKLSIDNVVKEKKEAVVEKQKKTEKPIQIESYFPDWKSNTPAHEILGLPKEGFSLKDLESAYKKRLLRLHPDKVSSWGSDYQKKAHEMMVLLQNAHKELKTKIKP